MNPELELCFVYGNVRKLIIFHFNTPFSEFKELLKAEFRIPNRIIILIDQHRNAEITSAKSFKEEHEILIVPEEEPEGSIDNQAEPETISNNDFNNTDSGHIINFEDLENKTFQKKTLLDKLNLWTNEKNFKLYVSEGTKKLKKEF